jgi:hypothetical protein
MGGQANNIPKYSPKYSPKLLLEDLGRTGGSSLWIRWIDLEREQSIRVRLSLTKYD